MEPLPGNQVLASLPAQVARRLTAGGRLRELPRNGLLFEAGDLIDHIYFPCGAVLALYGSTSAGERIQIALCGAEGMVGALAMMEPEHAPWGGAVRVAGAALLVPASLFRSLARESRALEAAALHALRQLVHEAGRSTACARFHDLAQRTARILLHVADRVESEDLPLTHQDLADSAGVYRASMTRVLDALRLAGLIELRRGRLRILDRSGLVARACDCYVPLHFPVAMAAR